MSIITGMNKNKAIGIFISIFVISATIGVTLTIIYYDEWKITGNSVIAILKDHDFENKYDFSGNGTSSNPYLIENLIIDTTKSIAISIQGTTRYFIIRNCTISAKCCINIFNVTMQTARIENNTLLNKWSKKIRVINDLDCCISIQYSHGTLIQNNNCYNDFEYAGQLGIRVFYSDNTKIINNKCSNHNYGMEIRRSNNLLIIGNNCTFNQHYGISIVFTDNTTIMDNICTKGENSFSEVTYIRRGMYIRRGTNSLVSNNSCSFFQIGMDIELQYSIIEMNNLSYNTDEGLRCYVFNSTLKNNIMKGNWIGMLLGSERSSIIENLFLENLYIGIQDIFANTRNIIYHNNFINNNLFGYGEWTAQAYSEESYSNDEMSLWYNSYINEGNYWSDLEWNEGVVYYIDGGNNLTDPYPLANPY